MAGHLCRPEIGVAQAQSPGVRRMSLVLMLMIGNKKDKQIYIMQKRKSATISLCVATSCVTAESS